MAPTGSISIGTRVRLIQDHGVGSTGDEGLVTGQDDSGDFTVRITNKPDCTPLTLLLFGVPAGKLSTNTVCA